MKLRVINYDEVYDDKALNLFYQSNFYNKKEFDYVRVPPEWLFRYNLSNDYITKIALLDNEVIGSIGLLIGMARFAKKKIKVGCFVDNCVLPKYSKERHRILESLFKELEKESKVRGIDIIAGWEYLKNVNQDKGFFEKLGFKWVDGANWISSSVVFSGTYPFEWKTKSSVIWSFLFRIMSRYHCFKEKFNPPLPESMIIRNMNKDDIKNLCDMAENIYSESSTFRVIYDYQELENLFNSGILHGLIVEDNSKIIGFLTYIISAWSGWMFGKPYYDKNWQIFYGFTPDEFVVLSEYQKTSLPAHMILQLMKTKNPEEGLLHKRGYSFVADVFDTRIEWRKNALLQVGCIEPKFDYGVILAKSLRDDIELDTNKIWHLPARYIVAPVPSSSYFQKPDQQGV